MQADLSDVDAARRQGKERAATHFALWSLIVNISTAAGAAIALGFIGWAGFIAGALPGDMVASQPDRAISAIAFAYAGLPMVFKLPAWWLMRGYGVTKEAMIGLNPRGQSSPESYDSGLQTSNAG